jgi:hypothetical protein
MRVAFNSPARNQLWESRSTGGPLACNQQMGVQLPPLPPNSPGRPLRSGRQSEKLDKHVRLVLLAPSVTVAEWLRRATVVAPRRIPSVAGALPGALPAAQQYLREFDSLRSPHSLGGRPMVGRGFLKPDTAVRVCPSHPVSRKEAGSSSGKTQLSES